MHLARRGARRALAPASLSLGHRCPGRTDSFAAHRDLLAAAIRLVPVTSSSRRPELTIPPLPPSPSWTRMTEPEIAPLWGAAVREHAELTRLGTREAEASLIALTEHLERAARLSWAPEPGVFDRAVDETLLWVVFDADVSSRPAQAAWRRWWSEQPYGLEVGPRDAVEHVRRAAVRERELRAEWAAAWAIWAARARIRQPV